MKYACVAALSLIAGALAAPANMVTDQQMKAVELLHNNKEALGLSQEQSDNFDKFMASLNKRDTAAAPPMGGAMAPGAAMAPGGAVPTPGAMAPGGGAPGGLGGAVNGLTGAASGALGSVGNTVGGLTSGLTGGGDKGGDMKKGGLLGGALIPGIL